MYTQINPGQAHVSLLSYAMAVPGSELGRRCRCLARKIHISGGNPAALAPSSLHEHVALPGAHQHCGQEKARKTMAGAITSTDEQVFHYYSEPYNLQCFTSVSRKGAQSDPLILSNSFY